MLIKFPKAVRLWLATALVGFYTLGVLLPIAAFALNAEHCPPEEHGITQNYAQGSNAVHETTAGPDHQHAGDADHGVVATDDGSNIEPTTKCCGVAIFAAVAPELGFALVRPLLAGQHGFGIKQALAGLPPQELIRPPKFLS